MEKEFQAAGGCKVYTPDPTAYHDVSTLRLANSGGRSVGDVLPSRWGIRGVVLPRATLLGGSRAKPEVMTTKVNVYSDVEGEPPIVVDMAEIEEGACEREFNAAQGEDLGSIALEVFSKLAGKRRHVPTPEVLPAPQSLPGATVIPHATTSLERPQVKVPPSVKLAESQMNQTAKASVASSALSDPCPIVAPIHRVTFELEGFGTFETAYHKVVCGDDGVALVLVYDNRYQSGLKYFPQASDQDMFVDVHDMPDVFKVKSTGMKYNIDHLEHCILLIETRAPKG